LPALIVVAVVAAGAQIASVAAVQSNATPLPKRLTTPTGNFITLYSVDSKGGGEDADVSICTSAHTPAGTEAIPLFFTLQLSNGALVHVTTGAKSPALQVTPLGPKQCVRGWIRFAVPHGKHAVLLVYQYGSPIKWKLR
jgi:hypothetical protein